MFTYCNPGVEWIGNKSTGSANNEPLMQNFASQLHDKLLRNTWKNWYNLITKQIQKKSGPHYLKECLQHILILTDYSQCVTSKQPKSAFAAGNPSSHSWQSGRQGSWDLGWLSWGHYCTQSNPTHNQMHIDTHKSLVADNSHPVIFDCRPLMLDQRHLTLRPEGLGPPGVPLPPQRDCQKS